MKMRNEIVSPRDGVVRDLRVHPGANVKAREPLVSVRSE
jgi:biotin carboxyl carrier protein